MKKFLSFEFEVFFLKKVPGIASGFVKGLLNVNNGNSKKLEVEVNSLKEKLFFLNQGSHIFESGEVKRKLIENCKRWFEDPEVMASAVLKNDDEVTVVTFGKKPEKWKVPRLVEFLKKHPHLPYAFFVREKMVYLNAVGSDCYECGRPGAVHSVITKEGMVFHYCESCYWKVKRERKG